MINSKRTEISLPTEKLKVHQWWWTTVPLHYCHLERAKALTLTTSPGLSRTSTGDSEGPGRADLVINRGSSTQWQILVNFALGSHSGNECNHHGVGHLLPGDDYAGSLGRC